MDVETATDSTETPAKCGHLLTPSQVSKLNQVLESTYEIHGIGNFPSLEVKPKVAIRTVLEHLKPTCVSVRDVRINGSVASFAISDHPEQSYNDLDILFGVDFDDNNVHEAFDVIRDAVLESLLEWFPEDVDKSCFQGPGANSLLLSAYVQKMFKVPNKHATRPQDDCWSIISLRNNMFKNVELKFLKRMKRQCEFSVDSFQIILDDSFLNSEGAESCDFFTLRAESMYGDFEVARHHLNNRLISIQHPEHVIGGGLLKYCNLMSQGFKPATEEGLQKTENMMCNRFFLDYRVPHMQGTALAKYLATHFNNRVESGLVFLGHLHGVVDRSSVNERDTFLSMITHMRNMATPPPSPPPQHVDVAAKASKGQSNNGLAKNSNNDGPQPRQVQLSTGKMAYAAVVQQGKTVAPKPLAKHPSKTDLSQAERARARS
eukprot:Colp12_sorted_trinity150504_noHs@26464